MWPFESRKVKIEREYNNNVKSSVYHKTINNDEYIVTKIEFAHLQYEYIPKKKTKYGWFASYEVHQDRWVAGDYHPARFTTLEDAIDFIKTGNPNKRKKTKAEIRWEEEEKQPRTQTVRVVQSYDYGWYGDIG